MSDDTKKTPAEEVSETKETKTTKGTKATTKDTKKKPTKAKTEPVAVVDKAVEVKASTEDFGEVDRKIPSPEEIKEHAPEVEEPEQFTMGDLAEMKKLLQDSLISQEEEEEVVGRNHQQEIFGGDRKPGKRKKVVQGKIAPVSGTIFSGGRWIKG